MITTTTYTNAKATPFSELIQRAGSIVKLSQDLDVTPPIVRAWLERGFFPPKRAMQLAFMYDLPFESFMRQEEISGIQMAVINAGGQVNLASMLGVTQQAICRWFRRGWVPVERATQIHSLFNDVSVLDLIKPELKSMFESQLK